MAGISSQQWKELYARVKRQRRARREEDSPLLGGRPSTGDTSLDAISIWMTTQNEAYTKQWRSLTQFSLSQFADTIGNLSEMEDPAQSLRFMAVSAGATLGAGLARKMANDKFTYGTMAGINSLNNFSGDAGAALSTKFSVKEGMIKEAQDTVGGAFSAGGALLGALATNVGKLAPAGTPPTLLLKGASMLLGFVASGYLANKGDEFGRKIGKDLISGYADKMSDKSMVSSFMKPQRVVNFAKDAMKAFGIYGSIYKGNDLMDITKKFMDNGNMYFFGQSMESIPQLVSRINSLTSVGPDEIKQLTQRIAKFSGSTGYEAGDYTNLYANVKKAYGNVASKNRDVNAVFEGVEKLMIAAMGASNLSQQGIDQALGLSNLAQSLTLSKGGVNKGNDVVSNIAGMQNFVRLGIGSTRGDSKIIEGAIGGINAVLEDGASFRNPARNRFVSKLHLSVSEAYAGVEGNKKILPKFLDQIIKDSGLKKGDIFIKDGALAGDLKKLGRLRMYLMGNGTTDLGLDRSQADPIAMMTAAYLDKGAVGLNDVEKELPEFKKAEVTRSRLMFMDSGSKIKAASARLSDSLLPLIEKAVPSFIEIHKMTIEYFKVNGVRLAEEFAKQINQLFYDMGTGTVMNFNGTSAWSTTAQTIVSNVREKLGTVIQSSSGFKKYASKFQAGFIEELEAVAKRLNIDPNWLLAAISFETNGTFDPTIRDGVTGTHIGLLQFSADFRGRMQEKYGVDITTVGQVGQLKYVEEYLQPSAKYIQSAGDLYLAVAGPAHLRKGSSANQIIYSGETAAANKKWDANQDGVVTRGEITTALERDALSMGFLVNSDTGGSYSGQASQYYDQVRQSNINLKKSGLSISEDFSIAALKTNDYARNNVRNLNIALFGQQRGGLTSMLFSSEAFRAQAHEGLDFGIRDNTPIVAMADGVVNFAATGLDGYGVGLSVRYKIAGIYIDAFYGHLMSFSVKAGDKVSKGQIIALSGSSGNVTGAHLHFQAVIVDDEAGIEFRDKNGLWNYFNKVKKDVNFVNAFSGALQIMSDPKKMAGAISTGMTFVDIKQLLEKQFPGVKLLFDNDKKMYIIDAYNSSTGKGVTDSTKQAITNFIRSKNKNLSFAVSNKKTLYVKVTANGSNPGALARTVGGKLR